MKPTRVAVGVVAGLTMLVGGLLAAKPSAPVKPRPPVLPSWAPKHPSKEFLRAAKVLTPVPPEAQAYTPVYVPAWELFGSLSDKQTKQLMTLSQRSQSLAGMGASRQQFLEKRNNARRVGDKMVWSEGELSVPVKSVTSRQRAIFDSLVKVWGNVNPGGPDEDLLVYLYKARAKKDLSNVWVRFSILGGHAVHLGLEVRGAPASGGPQTDTHYSATSPSPVWIAQL